MNYDAVIVGAGLSGSTAARLLAEKGSKARITNDAETWKFTNRFTDFHYLQHRVPAYAEGRMIPFPINADTIVLSADVARRYEEILEEWKGR